VIYITHYSLDYAYMARQLWDYNFMTAPNGDIHTVGQPIYLYSVTSLKDFVNNTVNNYYSLDSQVQFGYYQ
jgi:hypothetical protein